MRGPGAPVWARTAQVALAGCCLILPQGALAEIDHTTLLGAGVRSRPAYDGSTSRVQDIIPIIRYIGDTWFIRSSQEVLEGGVRRSLRPDVQAGIQLAYEPGRETSESHLLALHHVPDVGHGTSAGAFVEWDRMLGPMPVSLLVRGRQDTRLSHGAQADVRLNAGVYGTARLGAEVFAQAGWATRQSNETLYGITRETSAVSGLPAFQPGAGWSYASSGLIGSLNVTHSWTVVASTEWHWLNGSVAQSPLDERRGSFYASLGLAFRP